MEDRIQIAREKLNAATMETTRRLTATSEQIQKKAIESNQSIVDRWNFVKDHAGRVSVQQSVSRRMDTGFSDLERIVQALIEARMGRGELEGISLDSESYKAIKAEAKRIAKSDFFKTLRKQLKVETTGEQQQEQRKSGEQQQE